MYESCKYGIFFLNISHENNEETGRIEGVVSEVFSARSVTAIYFCILSLPTVRVLHWHTHLEQAAAAI